MRRAEAPAEDGGDRLFCFAMQRPVGPAEKSRSQPLPARVACRPIALQKAVFAKSPALGRRDRTVGVDGSQTRLFDSGREEQKAGDVLRCQLNPHRCPNGIEAEDLQILVKVAQPR